jgi:hypothetical protein
LRPDSINFTRFESQPLQEALVASRVATLEQFVPLCPFRLVEANLLEHRDPFVYIYMVFHMSLLISLIRVCACFITAMTKKA